MGDYAMLSPLPMQSGPRVSLEGSGPGGIMLELGQDANRGWVDSKLVVYPYIFASLVQGVSCKIRSSHLRGKQLDILFRRILLTPKQDQHIVGAAL